MAKFCWLTARGQGATREGGIGARHSIGRIDIEVNTEQADNSVRGGGALVLGVCLGG